MQLVIADTGPINYLILTGHIDLLPVLFRKVVLPRVVQGELWAGPSVVRQWALELPEWVEVIDTIFATVSLGLDAGEDAAIALAIELHAELLLMDDREGVSAARSRGLTVTGTLGVLGLAARRGLVDLNDAFERLKRTNFHYRQSVMDQLLRDASGLG